MIVGKGVNRPGKGINRSGQDFWFGFIPLTNFGVPKFYQNEPRLDSVYSRGNLPKTKFHSKIKDGAYVINIYQYVDIGAHWIVLYTISQYANSNTKTLAILWHILTVFELSTFQKKLIQRHHNKHFWIQTYDSVVLNLLILYVKVKAW